MSLSVFHFNKLTSVFSCICPLIDDKFRHNIVSVVDPRATGEWIYNKLTMLGQNLSSIREQTHKKLTSICFSQ